MNKFIFLFIQVGWYWGPLNWIDAERLLKDKQDYSFLVRDSNHRHYFLAITFKSEGNIHHTRIEHNNSSFQTNDLVFFYKLNFFFFL